MRIPGPVQNNRAGPGTGKKWLAFGLVHVKYCNPSLTCIFSLFILSMVYHIGHSIRVNAQINVY